MEEYIDLSLNKSLLEFLIDVLHEKRNDSQTKLYRNISMALEFAARARAKEVVCAETLLEYCKKKLNEINNKSNIKIK